MKEPMVEVVVVEVVVVEVVVVEVVVEVRMGTVMSNIRRKAPNTNCPSTRRLRGWSQQGAFLFLLGVDLPHPQTPMPRVQSPNRLPGSCPSR